MNLVVFLCETAILLTLCLGFLVLKIIEAFGYFVILLLWKHNNMF